MFTIKLYAHGNLRQRIFEAESFTILRDDYSAEITLHQKNPNDDSRCDINSGTTGTAVPQYERAIIENSAGKTTEIISFDWLNKPKSAQIGGASGEIKAA